MLIVIVLYAVLLWLVFSKLKLVRLGWVSGAIAGLIGVFILAVFVSFLNYLTPSGRIVVTGRVVEVAPNVSGQVTSVPVKANVPVKAGAVLFEIDRAPYQYKVRQLEATLAQAEQQARQLQANYDQASANVEGLKRQLAYNRKRLADIQTLAQRHAATEFREQDAQIQVEMVNAQLQAALAAQANAKIALEAEVGGVNPTVAQITAQLDNARWELEQATIRAPSDGYATVIALAVGDRATPLRPVMSFILADDLTIVGMFAPNGFQTIKPGAAVTLVFDTHPGQRYRANIADIPLGVGQGQVAVSGTLARTSALQGVKEFPVTISIPEQLDRRHLRLGMPGTATVFAEDAGVVGVIASILIWISSYTAYL